MNCMNLLRPQRSTEEMTYLTFHIPPPRYIMSPEPGQTEATSHAITFKQGDC